MWWWLKARRAHTVLPALIAAFALLVLLLQGRTVIVPSFLSASASVPLVLSLPVTLCAALALCLDSRLAEAEDTSRRSVRRLDTALVLVTALVPFIIGSFTYGFLDGSDNTVNIGRNTAFLMGLMLIARPFVGTRSIALPVIWIFAVLFVGRGPGNHMYFWTVLPRETGDPIAAVGAAAAFLAGLSFLLTGYRSRTAGS